MLIPNLYAAMEHRMRSSVLHEVYFLLRLLPPVERNVPVLTLQSSRTGSSAWRCVCFLERYMRRCH